MKEIPLTRGKLALVDDEDYGWLTAMGSWCAHLASTTRDGHQCWYAVRRVKGEFVYMHRILAAVAGLRDVDHWDRDGLHNWRENLRPCTRGQNNANHPKLAKCSSSFKNVYLRRATVVNRMLVDKWVAQERIDGKTVYIGSFDTEEEAGAVAAEVAKRKFGEFARA